MKIILVFLGLITMVPPSETSEGTGGRWIGIYATQGSTTYVADSTFISNGIAKLSNSPYSYYFIGYRYYIPANKIYFADNIKLEARVKNPISEGAIEELDVSLVIGGSRDSVLVNYVGRSHRQDCTLLGVYNGRNILKDEPKLIQLFQEWTTITLEVKKGVVSTYINKKLLKSYSIGSTRLGILKMINVGFKGVGSVDWVKVYDETGKVRIKEEFNRNQSSVEFFDLVNHL